MSVLAAKKAETVERVRLGLDVQRCLPKVFAVTKPRLSHASFCFQMLFGRGGCAGMFHGSMAGIWVVGMTLTTGPPSPFQEGLDMSLHLQVGASDALALLTSQAPVNPTKSPAINSQRAGVSPLRTASSLFGSNSDAVER